MLQCLINYRIDEDLMKFLKKKKIKTPEKLFLEMSLYPSKKRRPFDAIMFYWRALGNKIPQCSEEDIVRLKRDFDDIFFAWRALRFKPPRFPYAYLFHKIVNTKKELYTPGIIEMTRFVRRLRCQSRKARYDELFDECVNFDYRLDIFKNNSLLKGKMNHTELPDKMNHTKLPDKIPEQIITTEKVRKPRILDVHDIKNVYRSQKEFDEAVKNDNFDIAKTFHIDKQGNLYSLCFKPNDVQVQKVPIRDDAEIQLQQTQKLNELLRQQSLL